MTTTTTVELRIPGLVMDHFLGSGFWSAEEDGGAPKYRQRVASRYENRRTGRGWSAIYSTPPGWLLDVLYRQAQALYDVCSFGSGTSAERSAAETAMERIDALRRRRPTSAWMTARRCDGWCSHEHCLVDYARVAVLDGEQRPPVTDGIRMRQSYSDVDVDLVVYYSDDDDDARHYLLMPIAEGRRVVFVWVEHDGTGNPVPYPVR